MSSSKPSRIDVHAHVLVEDADALVRGHFDPSKEPALFFADRDSAAVSLRNLAEVRCKLTTPADRLQDMDRMGIDMQVLSPSPNQYYYWSDPVLGLAAARAINNRIAAIVRERPERFAGLGSVPLQEPSLAVSELGRCLDELGLCGVEIGSQVNGVDYDDPRFEPFFAAAEAQRALVFLHPLGFTHGERLRKYHLNNVIGNPLESSIALAHLICGGVFDRHPELRLCVAHGGGYLPLYAGRIEHACQVRDDCRRSARRPSEYLQRIYFDTVVHSAKQLEWLVNRYGSSQLLLGTDYPFDMGEPDPLGLIAKVRGLTDNQREAIAGLNALRLIERGERRDT